MNNIEIIRKLLNFESDDTFYFCQIIKRKKEHPDLGSNNVVIKTYYVSSFEYLDLKIEEIITLCELHNARAYINLTSRSFERVAFHTLKKVTDCIMNKDFKLIRKSYDSVCGEYGFGEKRWIIDVDIKDFDHVIRIATIINRMQSTNEVNVIAYIPTKNGWHIITKPFDLKQFEPYKVQNQLDIHKNNPTILYFKDND